MRLQYEGSPTDSRAFVDAPLTDVAITLLGGVAFSFFLTKFLRMRLERAASRPLETMAKAGLYGLGATFCAFEILYLLSAVYLVVSPRSPVHASGFGLAIAAFIGLFIDLQFLGATAVAVALPFSFLFGSVAGLGIWKASTL